MDKTIEERQNEVFNKIEALPKIGEQLIQVLKDAAAKQSILDLVLMASLKRELWDEYQSVLRDTTDRNANEFFDKMAKAKESTIF